MHSLFCGIAGKLGTCGSAELLPGRIAGDSLELLANAVAAGSLELLPTSLSSLPAAGKQDVHNVRPVCLQMAEMIRICRQFRGTAGKQDLHVYVLFASKFEEHIDSSGLVLRSFLELPANGSVELLANACAGDP